MRNERSDIRNATVAKTNVGETFPDRAELDREVGWLTIRELPLPTMMSSDAVVAPRAPAL